MSSINVGPEAVISSIFLVIDIICGIYMIWKLHRLKHINMVSRRLFLCSLFIACIMAVSSLLEALNLATMRILIYMLFFSNFVLVYMFLVWRTHVTFRTSVFALSRGRKLKFGILLLFLIVLPCPAGYFFSEFHDWDRMSNTGRVWLYLFTVLSYCSWFLLYPISVVMAISVFQSKLLSLAKLIRRVSSQAPSEITKLSKRQQVLCILFINK